MQGDEGEEGFFDLIGRVDFHRHMKLKLEPVFHILTAGWRDGPALTALFQDLQDGMGMSLLSWNGNEHAALQTGTVQSTQDHFYLAQAKYMYTVPESCTGNYLENYKQ